MGTQRNTSLRLGLTLVGFLCLFAWLAPNIVAHDPLTSFFDRGISPTGLPAPPSWQFWLGTDRLYRDQFSRIAFGARTSLLIGVAATLVATLIGTLVGTIAGFWHDTLADTLLMRVVDVGLAFPFLLLVIALAAALDHTSATTIFLTLGFTGWLGTARLVRARTMQLKHVDFVVGAQALGRTAPGIVVYHILPNMAGTLLVIASTSVAQMILAESVLSFLGGGISPPTPTWGSMLFEGQDYLSAAPWVALAPGFAMITSIFGFNLLGEGLRDALDSPTR